MPPNQVTPPGAAVTRCRAERFRRPSGLRSWPLRSLGAAPVSSKSVGRSDRSRLVKLAGCLALSAVLTGGCLTRGRIQEPAHRLGEPIELSALLTVYAASAKSVGYSQHEVLGLSLAFREHEVEADVDVQVCEPLYSDRSCFASAPATYRVGVADDAAGAVCSRFLRSIVNYWKEKDEGYLRSYRVLPADKHVLDSIRRKRRMMWWPRQRKWAEAWLVVGRGG